MFRIEPAYVELLRHIGLNDAWSAFEHPQIRVWRSIPERENATLDVSHPDGRTIRLHLKRDKFPQHDAPSGAEAAQLLALAARGIPTAKLVAYGWLADNRSVVVTEDLAGYSPADKLIQQGMAFDRLLEPTAALVGRLHAAGAFHRDLYLCHILARPADCDVRLIDCARLLLNPFWRRRWQIKDLAQFAYSTRSLNIAGEPMERWFARYAAAVGNALSPRMRRLIDLKADWIARHDARLRQKQPDRNISIPDQAGQATP